MSFSLTLRNDPEKLFELPHLQIPIEILKQTKHNWNGPCSLSSSYGYGFYDDYDDVCHTVSFISGQTEGCLIYNVLVFFQKYNQI